MFDSERYVKEDIMRFIEDCVEDYRQTGDRTYLYRLVGFLQFLHDVSVRICSILRQYNVPVAMSGSGKTAPKPTVCPPVVRTAPIIIEVPEILLKVPGQAETESGETAPVYTQEEQPVEQPTEYEEEEQYY